MKKGLKYLMFLLLGASFMACSQKKEIMINQNPNITADNIVEEISKQVKHYPSEKIYKLSYLNEISFFKLFVNDILIYREYQFPQGGSAVEINNVINKSGVYKVSYQLFPIEKTKEYDEVYKTLTDDSNLMLKLKSYDLKNKEAWDQEYLEYSTAKIETKVTDSYSTYKFEGAGKTYYEGSFDITVDVPYELHFPFENAQDLRKMDRKELETKLLTKYKEVWQVYQNKELDNIAKLEYDALKNLYVSNYDTKEIINKNWAEYLKAFKSPTFKMQPIEKYKLEFFADGKMAALMLDTKDNRFRGNTALWAKVDYDGGLRPLFLDVYCYLPQGETEFKVY